MLKLVLIAIAVVAISVFGMCFNIIFRKDGKFPEYEVGENREMRKLGIKCVRQEEAEAAARRRSRGGTTANFECNESCSDCGKTQCR